MSGWRHRSRAVGAVGVLLACPAALGSTDGGEVIARARAAEAAQLRALARAPVQLHTRGFVFDGKDTHQIESFRRLQYGADGTVANTFERGVLDGKPVGEAELRKAMGAPEPGKDRREMLTFALAPLSAPDMEVTAVGPAAGGGYTLRCKVPDNALVSFVTLVVDEKTGRKRTATIEVASVKAKLADRLENVLTYADDGAPAEFHAAFHFKMAWIERAAEFTSKRVATLRP
jgi:hypothetical protein